MESNTETIVENASAATNAEAPALPDISSAMSKTTTISTIAVHSGKTRLVIALLHCGDWMQLKILEVTPELTKLGNTVGEALELQKAHDEVLRQLQNKQSPVEELLRQADQLISTQKPRAEVYAAMAESLGRAWKDINSHLELRKQILDLNVQYHLKAQEFFDTIKALENICADLSVPIDAETIKNFLTNIHDLRKSLLEFLMGALQIGNLLLSKLRELGAEGTLDSRPDRIRISVNQAVSQVQSWLDQLHAKRQLLEVMFNRRKAQLEQCLALAILASDLRDLEEALKSGRDCLLNTYQLGDSSSSAELLLMENKKLLPGAKHLQDQALKITKATEQLVASECFAGEKATEQAYTVLSDTTDYLTEIENRSSLLERVIAFFKAAENALTNLDELEIQLTSNALSITPSELSRLHERCSNAIDELTRETIAEGYSILDIVGPRQLEAIGIQNKVEELENKKISLQSICTAHHEEKLRINKSLNDFLEQHNLLYSWLVSAAQTFLQDHQDMGGDLSSARDFWNLHNRLLLDLQTKGNEINALLLTLPPVLEYLEDNQRRDVDSKVEDLHQLWLKLKNLLELRLDLAAIYVKFHTEASIVNNEMDKLENAINSSSKEIDDEKVQKLEEHWESLVPLYQSAKNTGITFINTANKVSESYLDVKRACMCVEAVLEKLTGRQLVITREWQSFQTDVVERKELLVEVEINMVESTKTITWVSKLDTQLYPVITTSSEDPNEILPHLHLKLETTLAEIKRAQNEIDHRTQTIDNLLAKSSISDDQILNIKNKLMELNRMLNDIRNEYQFLLQRLLSYFGNVSDLDKNIENINTKFNEYVFSNKVSDVETVIKEHETSKQQILGLFKYIQNECEKLSSQIIKTEPTTAAKHDIEKLQYVLRIRRDKCYQEWNNRRNKLDTQKHLSQFDSDLSQINETVDDIGKQVADVKEQFCDNLSVAKAKSQAFAYFEETVKMLGQRIDTFTKDAVKLQGDDKISQHIEEQIRKLNERWRNLQTQINDTRKLLDITIEYFQLVDEANEWFKHGSQVLVTIARKTTKVKTPEEAEKLLTAIEEFLKPGELKQTERIKQIFILANQIYGPQLPLQSSQVASDNREMLESFASITNELQLLLSNLNIPKEEQEPLEIKTLKENSEIIITPIITEPLTSTTCHIKEIITTIPVTSEAKILPSIEPVIAKSETKKSEHIEENKLGEETTTEIIEIVKITTINREQPHKIEISNQVKPPIFVSPLTDAVIEEGSKFSFVCQVEGEPAPSVTWFKDSISIENNPDYHTTFDNGLCTLKIEETFAEDSAKYACKAVNSGGSAETDAFLMVKETHPCEQLIPPNFIIRLQPLQIKQGQPFQLYCKVEGNPLPTVQWYKNDECIDNSADYVITYNNGEALLKCEEEFLIDKAEYTCKASNQVGIAQSTTTINVEPQQQTEYPLFVTPLSNVMARAGQKIKLECEVSGVPIPSITWSHNGKPVKETHELKVHFDNKKATLLISEAFLKDTGVYVARARNNAGESYSECTVTVKGRLPTETSDSEIASDMEPIKPSIQVSLKDITEVENSKVCLDCVIVGQPEPEVIWYHDESPVKESPDFQLLFQGDRCSLIIREAIIGDSGEYKVVALNSAGEASSTCKLTIKPLVEKLEQAPPVEEVSKPTGSSPKFEKLLTDVLSSEGEKVTFETKVTGVPRPTIKWSLNNVELQDNECTTVTYDDDGVAKLEIDKVLPSHKGVYTVKATNDVGDVKCFAQLIVKSSKPAEAEKVKTIPAFIEVFSDKTVTEDSPTKFECTVVGEPTPKITWLMNSEPVTGEDFRVSSSGDRQVLLISKVKPNLKGKITCLAENEAGKAECSALLTVNPPISVGDNIVKCDIVQNGNSSYTVQKEIVMQSTTSSTSQVTTNSSTQEPQLSLSGFVAQDSQTVKQINQQEPEIIESHVFEKFHQIDGKPPIIDEKSVSTLTIKEESKPQEVDVTAQIVQKASKARPPKFTSPIMGKIVDQGVDVVLEGIIDGSPTPIISWEKNGSELESGEHIEILFDHNRVQIKINQVTTNDSGRYTCKAVNEAGSAISTSDLVVKKTTFPPVFGRRLQAQVVKKGDRVHMDVEVTGIPTPEVTWFKDDKPIQEVLKDNFKLNTQGNSYSLLIEKADINHTGKYMVTAINEGGEAQSIADFAVFEPTPDTMVEVVKTVVFEDVHKHETLATEHTKESLVIPENVPITDVAAELPSDKPSPQPAITEPIKLVDAPCLNSIDIIKSSHEIKVSMKSEITKPVKEEFKHVEVPSEIKPDEKKSESLDEVVTENSNEIKPVIQEVTLEIKPESESIIETAASQEINQVPIEIQQLEEKSTCVETIQPESLLVEKPLTPEITKPIEEELTQPNIDHTRTPQEIKPIIQSKEIIPSTQQEPHYSSIIDTESSKEIQVFKLESTTSNFSSELSAMPKVTHIPIDINKANQSIQEPVDATNVPTEIELENEGIQTTSISKQSSLNFFVQKLKEGEEPSQLKELPKAIPLQPEIYTKFENTSQKTEQCFPPQPISLPTFDSTYQKPEIPIMSHQETYSKFDLQPEPPATIHFAPRISDIQEQRFSQDISTSSYKSNTVYESYGTHLKTDILNQPIRPVSPKPSLEGLEMEKLWIPHKEFEKVRPVSTLPSFNAGKESFRPISSLSEPSHEGLAMEKNWAHKFSESISESKPLPETNSWSTQTTLERKWEPIKHVTKSFVSKSENTMKTSLPAPYYVATVTDLHEKQFAEQQSSTISQFNREEVFEKKIIEDSGKKVSEVIKSWPPPSVVEETVPSRATQTPVFPTSYATPYTAPPSFGELYLEPGTPPEIGYAQPPPEFKSTHREIIKHFSQNESSFKQVVPPPLPPKQEKLHAPPIPDRVSKQNENRNVEMFSPRLDTPQFKIPKVQPSPTPSKFIRGRYGDSDYESDFESTRIPIKWTPSCSDTEEPQYRKVRPPSVTYNIRSKSVEPEQLPPSQYVKQNSVRESIKTFENIESKNLVENRLPTTQYSTYKIKPNMDGYMADTDEPFTLQRLSKSEYKHEETLKENYYSSNLTSSQNSQNNTFYEQRFVSKPTPTKSFKKHVPSSNTFKKELIATPIITSVTTNKMLATQDDRESSLEPFPYKAEPYRSKQPKAPPPPSPSKFIKGEFRESDYESDYDGRFSSTWRASAEPCYKPVRPILTPSGRQSQGSVRTPTPPSEFDKPPRFTGPPRPKFEPIEKPKTFVKINEVLNEKSSKSQIVHKPKAVTPKVTTIITSPQNDIVLQPGSPPEIAFASEPTFTQFYKSTTSKPHQNAVQTETSNVMHFKESTESSRRTVSLQQTKKIITFGNQQRGGEKLQAVPNKFKTNDFKESDYDSEVEMTKIKSSWGDNDTSESRYRRVQAPQISSGRYSSTPTSFKPETPKQNYEPPNLDLQPGSPPEYGYIPTTVTPTKATKLASKHMDDMTHAFKSKTQQFVSDIMTDVNKKTSETSIEKSKNENVPQVYREDSRATQYGTKHVDPDTGLIYFKYDFGYEFGVILPGQSKGGEIPVPQKTIIEPPKRTKDIEMPVYHESGQVKPKSNFPSSVKHKSVKWEPTSESEMSEYESDGRKKSDLISPRWEQYSSSPVSLSPSLPSTSPAFNTAGLETSSAPGTPRSFAQIGQKRPPSFITPLRDIAVICGETARFECIVQSEPLPTVLWARNGRIIENSNDYQIFFRNGVCRLTIPQTYPEDAGTYTCTATNQNGSIGTTATLQVPGVPSHMYGTYRQFQTRNRSASPELVLYERPNSPTILAYTNGKCDKYAIEINKHK